MTMTLDNYDEEQHLISDIALAIRARLTVGHNISISEELASELAKVAIKVIKAS